MVALSDGLLILGELVLHQTGRRLLLLDSGVPS
jgi:hypothetical protein